MSTRNDIISSIMSEVDNIRTSSDYSDSTIMRVTEYHENYESLYSDQTPLLMVVDLGNDRIVVRDDSHTRYAFDIEIWGFVARKGWSETVEELNGIMSDVKKWVNAGPSLDSAVLTIDWIEAMPHSYDPKRLRGLTGMTLNVIYYVDNGTY